MPRRKVSRSQLSLFDADQEELPFDAYAPPEPRARPRGAEQLPLFGGKAPLVGEVESALLAADFRAARSAYERLRETYPSDPSVSDYRFLLKIPVDLWESSHSNDERVEVWETFGQRFAPESEAYLRVRDGYFSRFLEVADARALALGHPAVAPDLANHLVDMEDWRTARELVRELLLAGHELRPLAFQDEAVRDLLGEEGAPAWLACLGAIRWIWPREGPDVTDLPALEARLGADLLETDHDKALDFWYCLGVTVLGSQIPEALHHNARRRMKRLHPVLHEEFMTRPGARTDGLT